MHHNFVFPQPSSSKLQKYKSASQPDPDMIVQHTKNRKRCKVSFTFLQNLIRISCSQCEGGHWLYDLHLDPCLMKSGQYEHFVTSKSSAEHQNPFKYIIKSISVIFLQT